MGLKHKHSLELLSPENKEWMVPAEPGRLDGLVGHITTLVELLEMSSTAWGDRVPRIEGREYSYCNSENKRFNFMHIHYTGRVSHSSVFYLRALYVPRNSAHWNSKLETLHTECPNNLDSRKTI